MNAKKWWAVPLIVVGVLGAVAAIQVELASGYPMDGRMLVAIAGSLAMSPAVWAGVGGIYLWYSGSKEAEAASPRSPGDAAPTGTAISEESSIPTDPIPPPATTTSPGAATQPTGLSRSAQGWLLGLGVVVWVGGGLLAVSLLSGGTESAGQTVVSAESASSTAPPGTSTSTTTTARSTTSSTRPTTTASKGFDGATGLNPFMATASASELLFGQPTEAWGDERGIVSEALVSASLVWSGPDEDDWQIVADGRPTELWISGGWGCVDDSCRKNMTFATYGPNSDRHVWWIDLGNHMKASVALGFELQSGESHSLACWSTAYGAPAVSTVAGTANGTIERAWVYADGDEGLTWYPAEADAIDPTNERPGDGHLYRC